MGHEGQVDMAEADRLAFASAEEAGYLSHVTLLCFLITLPEMRSSGDPDRKGVPQ
jgi:hypothetical protein